MPSSRTARRIFQSFAAATFALSAIIPLQVSTAQQATQQSQGAGQTRAQQFFAIRPSVRLPASNA